MGCCRHHRQPWTESGRPSPPNGDVAAAFRRLHVGPAARPSGRLMLVRRAHTIAALAAIAVGVPAATSAQNVAITSVKIIVGSGQVIESGTIIVRDGKIATVTGAAVQ